MISELKLNDFLKTDGQNCCALLLGLRNDYYLHQNLLIAKDLTVKSLAIFFLYSLLLQALTAFLRRAGDCYSQRSTIPATAFCTTFTAKVSETQGRKSWEYCCLLSTIYKKRQRKHVTSCPAFLLIAEQGCNKFYSQLSKSFCLR